MIGVRSVPVSTEGGRGSVVIAGKVGRSGDGEVRLYGGVQVGWLGGGEEGREG